MMEGLCEVSCKKQSCLSIEQRKEFIHSTAVSLKVSAKY